MIRPIGIGFSPAQPQGQQSMRPNQAGGRPSSFAVNPAASAGSAQALGQGSTDSDVTSSTNDLESLISQLPSNLQDLFQGYLDTSVSADKDPTTLLSDLGTLQDSVNTVLEQVQTNPDQPVDPNSLDTPALMADGTDTGAGIPTGTPGRPTGGRPSFGTPGGQGYSSVFSLGGAGAAINLGSTSAAPHSVGVSAAHAGNTLPGIRLNIHA